MTTDDRRLEVTFDCSRWWDSLTEEQRDIIAADPCDSYETDAAALDAAAVDSRVAELFRYLEIVNGGNGDTIGYSVEIHVERARDFDPQLIDGIEDRMAAEAAAKGGKG